MPRSEVTDGVEVVRIQSVEGVPKDAKKPAHMVVIAVREGGSTVLLASSEK